MQNAEGHDDDVGGDEMAMSLRYAGHFQTKWFHHSPFFRVESARALNLLVRLVDCLLDQLVVLSGKSEGTQGPCC